MDFVEARKLVEKVCYGIGLGDFFDEVYVKKQYFVPLTVCTSLISGLARG